MRVLLGWLKIPDLR